jgi:hypothetical protein
MCNAFEKQPYEVILEEILSSAGIWVKTYTYGLGKMSHFRNGEHYSSRGFLYPMRKPVYDPNAKEGDHQHALHLTPDVETASQLNSYGSHPLVVLPGPALWDDPGKPVPPGRCWHAASVLPLFCATCDRLTMEDLKNPAFWQELTNPRQRRRAVAPADDFVDLRIPRNGIWHREEKVAAEAT